MLSSGRPLASKLIAVIDDDPCVAEAISDLLRVWGAATVCASNGDELLQILAGRRPDAVIADRNLGRAADGFAVLTQLEARLGGRLPSLILTGDYDVYDQARANSTGRRVLHKPAGSDALLAALRLELAAGGILKGRN
jgi:CheY-like chemotaxis protein